MTFSSRRFATSSDSELLVDWLRATRPRQRATDYPSVIDLPHVLSLPHNQQTARLWFAHSGDLLGFAFLDAFHTLRFELDWQQSTPELEAAIVVWGNTCLTATPAETPVSLLYATAHQADRVRVAYLERQGFSRLADWIVHLERSLATPIKTPQLASGFSIRSVEGEHEAAELARLHREAFGTPHMTTERRLRLMRMTDYDPALDLVIVNVEGVRAAYGMGSLSPEENRLTSRSACYADQFATHPLYRGRGFARALLVTLLQRLQARGYATAKLTTSSENGPMLQVASSEGFERVSTTLRFARSLDLIEPSGPTRHCS